MPGPKLWGVSHQPSTWVNFYDHVVDPGFKRDEQRAEAEAKGYRERIKYLDREDQERLARQAAKDHPEWAKHLGDFFQPVPLTEREQQERRIAQGVLDKKLGLLSNGEAEAPEVPSGNFSTEFDRMGPQPRISTGEMMGPLAPQPPRQQQSQYMSPDSAAMLYHMITGTNPPAAVTNIHDRNNIYGNPGAVPPEVVQERRYVGELDVKPVDLMKDGTSRWKTNQEIDWNRERFAGEAPVRESQIDENRAQASAAGELADLRRGQQTPGSGWHEIRRDLAVVRQRNRLDPAMSDELKFLEAKRGEFAKLAGRLQQDVISAESTREREEAEKAFQTATIAMHRAERELRNKLDEAKDGGASARLGAAIAMLEQALNTTEDPAERERLGATLAELQAAEGTSSAAQNLDAFVGVEIDGVPISAEEIEAIKKLQRR